MVALSPPLRKAERGDAAVLAELVNMAGEGLALAAWKLFADPGEDPWDAGRRRAADRAETGQIVVIDEGAGAVAGLTGYRIDAPTPITDEMPGLFVPLQELENLVPETWYVNVLAALPGHRGKGHGTRLIALADQIAAEEGLDRLSLIVADINTSARRLYERCGYREHARRGMVGNDDWTPPGRDWVLLVKDGVGVEEGALP